MNPMNSEKLISSLRELSYQSGQLCPSCKRPWPICDDDNTWIQREGQHCPGRSARGLLAALTEDVTATPGVTVADMGPERNDLIRAGRQSWAMSEPIGQLPPGKYEPVPNPPPTCTDWCTAREASLGIAWDTIVIAKEALTEIRDMGPAWNERCCACGWQQIGMLDWKEQQHLPHGCPIGRAIEALAEIE